MSTGGLLYHRQLNSQEQAGNIWKDVLELMESSAVFRVSYLVAMAIKGSDLRKLPEKAKGLCVCEVA